MAARALAPALLALALAGCGNADEQIAGGGQLGGRTLTVYSLTRGPGGASHDEVDGQKLALAEAHGRVGRLLVNFAAFDLGRTRLAAATATQRAIADPQIIAAVADATAVTVPLLNAAGILQVAPGGDLGLAADPQSTPSGRRTVAPLTGGTVPPHFATRFRAAFGRAPTARARTGYRAMRTILRAIARAGKAGNDRTQVIRAYLAR
jgi:ABC-type branched-subunit amino acid transport system substrate-binding protein